MLSLFKKSLKIFVKMYKAKINLYDGYLQPIRLNFTMLMPFYQLMKN